ncbi:hypothetical protein [Brevundimonas sp. C43]|uniref:hypothetical protein n=1 Tax=Brevundimonas sp. C43 TaxID=3068314 RepID=UPI00273E0A66|nr:hypothetical protein [Brevundimonas sp. C43]
MLDQRELPLFWGLCGGFGMIPTYGLKGATSEARVRAWLSLRIGVFAGPVAAEAATPSIVALVKVLDFRVVALAIGWMAANDPRGFFNLVGRIIKAGLRAAVESKKASS